MGCNIAQPGCCVETAYDTSFWATYRSVAYTSQQRWGRPMRRGMSWATLLSEAAHASPSSNKVLWWWTRTLSVTGAVFTGSRQFWRIRCVTLGRLSYCDAALLVLLGTAACMLLTIIRSCKHLSFVSCDCHCMLLSLYLTI